MQEVVAEEDAALEQEEEEADAVPHDARLLHGQRAVVVLAYLVGWQAEVQAGQAAAQTCTPKTPPGQAGHPQTPAGHQLTVIVALNGADQAEELDRPAEVVLHLVHEDAGEELWGEKAEREVCKRTALPPIPSSGRWPQGPWHGRGPAALTESMFLEMMTVML